MRLYHWKCDGYGLEASVMAETLDAARHALMAEKKPLGQKPPAEPGQPLSTALVDWHMTKTANGDIDRMLAGDGYSVESHDVGDVVWTEVS